MSEGRMAELVRRAVVSVGGPDADTFLDNLFTADASRASPGQAVYAGLLTPQGKILFDFSSFRDGDRFLIDLPRALVAGFRQAADVLSAAGQGRDRRSVRRADRRRGVGRDGAPILDGPVDAPTRGWPGSAGDAPVAAGGATWRPTTASERGRLRRPPHRARRAGRRQGFRLRRGLSARCRHGPTRRRRFQEGLLHRAGGGVAHGTPRHGAAAVRDRDRRRRPCRRPAAQVAAGDKAIGTFGSSAGGSGLALVRLDRAKEAMDDGVPIAAGGAALTLALPPGRNSPGRGGREDERPTNWHDAR